MRFDCGCDCDRACFDADPCCDCDCGSDGGTDRECATVIATATIADQPVRTMQQQRCRAEGPQQERMAVRRDRPQ
jgi:hypothetical protein